MSYAYTPGLKVKDVTIISKSRVCLYRERFWSVKEIMCHMIPSLRKPLFKSKLGYLN